MTDIDTTIARKSIQALGGIAMRLPKMAAPIVKQLTTFVSMQSENVTNETFVAFGDILRRYKSEYKEIITILSSSLDYITEPEAKVYIYQIKMNTKFKFVIKINLSFIFILDWLSLDSWRIW